MVKTGLVEAIDSLVPLDEHFATFRGVSSRESRIHNAHPQSQILGDPNTPVQTRSSLKKISEVHALVSYIQAQKVSEALEDESWVEAMQEELNKKDREIFFRNKARLVAQGHRQEEGIDYDEFLLLAFLMALLRKRIIAHNHLSTEQEDSSYLKTILAEIPQKFALGMYKALPSLHFHGDLRLPFDKG
ncbi:hypothetical protein Tco_0565865 [Tanacetum coccineum]